MINEKVVEHLATISNLYSQTGNKWKSIAYEKASLTVERLDYELTLDVQLTDLKGIGNSIAQLIDEFMATGTSKKLEELQKQFGVDSAILKQLEQVIKIPKIGLKTAKKIYEQHGICTVDGLKKAVEDGTIVGKLAAIITDGVRFLEALGERMPWFEADSVAAIVLHKLQQVGRAKVAGSLRRRREGIRDFDFVAVANAADVTKVLDGKTFQSPSCTVGIKWIQGGDKKLVFELDINGRTFRKADVALTTEESFGNNLNYLTGSAQFNIALRQLALRKGYTINEHFTVRKADSKKMPSAKETDIFDILEIPFVPPECRVTGKEIGSIQFSTKHLIPKNVDVIQGDLHVHTSVSDGTYSPINVVDLAKKAGFKFIGISDHSKRTHGPDELALVEHAKNVKQLANKMGFPVFIGTEMDIRTNGELDYELYVLGHLDYIILATHRQNDKNIVNRQMGAILAIRAKYPNKPIMIAHLTGRRIGLRPGAVEEDWTDFFPFCAKNNIVLEINCQKDRRDIPAPLIRQAAKAGCTFSLGTDFHNNSLRAFKPGIIEARRGGLSSKNILNTDANKVFNWLKTGKL